MEIYITTLFLIFIFGLIDLRLNLTIFQKKYLIFFLYSIVVLQIGLRWETGSDWPSYYENYQSLDEFSTVIFNIFSGYELGYGCFTYIIKNIFDNYSFFLIIHALIFYWGIIIASKKYSPYIFISFLFFYATNLGLVGSNRQLLAIVICLWGLDFVMDKKPFKFLIIIGAASLFHTTAFFFGIYYFLNRKFKPVFIFSILVFSVLIGKSGLPFLIFSKLGSMFGEIISLKAVSYTELANDVLSENSLSSIGLFKRLFFLVIFSINFSYLSKKLTYYKLLYNGYVIGIIIYFLFSSSLLILVNRGSLYFNIMECFLISCQFLIFKRNIEKAYAFFILFLISIVFLYQSIAAYPELFNPYKSLFYNINFEREMNN